MQLMDMVLSVMCDPRCDAPVWGGIQSEWLLGWEGGGEGVNSTVYKEA